MTVYIALLIVALFLLLGALLNNRLQVICSGVLMGILLFLSAFRYNVGMDYRSYSDIYHVVERNGWHGGIEQGYIFICKLCTLVNGSSQLMFLVLSLLTLGFIYFAYKRYSDNLTLTIFIFMCFGQMYLSCFNGIRQSLSIALFMYALRFIKERDMWKYLGIIALACTIHTVSVILFPLYWILDRKPNRLVWAGLLVISLLSARIIVTIIINSSYAFYIAQFGYTSEVTIMRIIYFAFSAVVFCLTPRLFKDFEYRNIFLNLNAIGMILFAMYFVFANTPLTMVVTRLQYFVIYSYAVIFTKLIWDAKSPLVRYGALTMFIPISAFLFIRSTVLEGATYKLIPFQFNFQLFN